MKLRFGKWDMVAFAFVALVAFVVLALYWLPGASAGRYAQVYQDGKLIKTLSLDAEQDFEVEGSYKATVTVRDGRIAVTASDCPGGDCVRCGWIDGAGRSIVCLPGGLEIRVVGSDADVDFVVG